MCPRVLWGSLRLLLVVRGKDRVLFVRMSMSNGVLFWTLFYF